jgi:hypothetical protein
MKLYCSMPLLGLYAARDHTIARKGADYALGPSPVAALVGKRGAVQTALLFLEGIYDALYHHERVVGKVVCRQFVWGGNLTYST